MECDYPFILEKLIKDHFNNKFNLIAGKEFFEGNEFDIKSEFIKLITDHQSQNYKTNSQNITNLEYKIEEVKKNDLHLDINDLSYKSLNVLESSGKMEDFIVDSITDKMVNIEECVIKSHNPIKPLKGKIIVVPKKKNCKVKPNIVMSKKEQKNDDKYFFVKDLEWKILYKFFDLCYNQKRFDSVEYWTNVGMGIKNKYGDNGFELYKYFSNKASPDLRDDDVKLKYKYDSFRSNGEGITISTLYYYAKEDNKDKFKELIITESPMKNMDLTEYGVATYIKYLEPNNFIWKDGNLYCYNGKYWEKNDIIMRKFISTTLFDFLNDIITTCFWDNPKFDTMKQLLNKLKKVDFKKCVVINTSEVFGKVETEFDMKFNLFGFNDRVYDLNTGEFRDYRFDDYITMTTGYDWREPTKEEIATIEQLLDKIFPKKDEMKLYLEILSTTLEGRCLENFITANGKGRNGKGFTHDLLIVGLGKFAFVANCSLLFEKPRTGPNPEKANIHMKRLVIFREPPRHQKMQNSIIKELTGSGSFAGRGLQDSNTEKELHCTIILECNQIPLFAETPEIADIDRFIDAPFRSSFTAKSQEEVDVATYTYMPDVKYKTVEFKKQHKYALIKIIMEAYKRYKKRNYKFDVPNEIKMRSLNHLQMSCNILSWVKESFDETKDKKDIITLKEMYNLFKSSEYFFNLSKTDKRLYNYGYFIRQISENIFFRNNYKEYLNVGPRKYTNLLTGYKIKTIE